MPRDSGGNYSLPAGTIVATGDTVLPSQHNPPFNDVASAITGSLSRSGLGGMLADLDMGGFDIKNGRNITLTGSTPVISFGVGGSRIASPAPNRLSIFKDGNPQERLTVNEQGETLVFGRNTSYGSGNDLQGSGSQKIAAQSLNGTDYYALSTYHDNSYTAVQFVELISGTPQEKGAITVSVSGTVYGSASDYRLKNIEGPLTGSLARVCATPVYWGTFKDDDVRMPLLLAHELQAVSPHLVIGDKDAIGEDGEIRAQQVDYAKIAVDLIGAIQELSARIAALEARNA